MYIVTSDKPIGRKITHDGMIGVDVKIKIAEVNHPFSKNYNNNNNKTINANTVNLDTRKKFSRSFL